MTLRPSKRDARDARFASHRFFGTATSFPLEYEVIDPVVPDQNKDQRPTACTAYDVTRMLFPETHKEYSHDFQFMKTLQVMGADGSQGADFRTALTIPVTIGLLPKELEPPSIQKYSQAWAVNPANWPVSLNDEALKNRIPAYSPIMPALGQDWFDAIRTILVDGLSYNRTVGVGTQWSSSFENISEDGILPDSPFNLHWGHAYEITGWKHLNGQPYLICKTWQGTTYGDKGYCYMSRTLCNRLMSAWGAFGAAYVSLSDQTVSTLKEQRISTIQVTITLLQNLLNMLLYHVGLI